MFDDPLEVIEHRGHKIEVFQDDQNMDTPNDWDPETVCLFHEHRDFCAFPRIKGEKMQPHEGYHMFDVFHKENTYEFAGITFWLFAVYAYIHSGVSLYSNRRAAMQYEPTGFDTSFKGFCLVNKESYPTIEEAEKIRDQHLESWNQILSGDVYGYLIDGAGGCWGFYGKEGKEQMIAEAKAEIEFDYPTFIEKIGRLWILQKLRGLRLPEKWTRFFSKSGTGASDQSVGTVQS
jgi:hypothetical protein